MKPRYITRRIPDTVTCLNLLSGCIACVMAFEAKYEWAAGFILLGAIFDFFDGMLARLLHAHSPIGKELDSLADIISFGMAPAVMLFTLLKDIPHPDCLQAWANYLPYSAFLIAIFSGLRLAKFNVDERQTGSFIGLPTPANALFWASLIVGLYPILTSPPFHTGYLIALIITMSWLLIAEIPMFSLKVKNLSWKDNKIRILFLTGSIPLLITLKTGGFAAIIGWYILLSLATKRPSESLH